MHFIAFGKHALIDRTQDVKIIALSACVTTSAYAFCPNRGLEAPELQFLRGEYDVPVVAEVSSFEDAAAVKVLVAASGALDELETLE